MVTAKRFEEVVVNLPEVKVNIPETEVDAALRVTPPELLIVKLLTVAGNPNVTWAEEPVNS